MGDALGPAASLALAFVAVILAVLASLLVALILTARYGLENPTAEGGATAAPRPPQTEDEWNLRLVQAGFRSYLWCPRAAIKRVAPPEAPAGVELAALPATEPRQLFVHSGRRAAAEAALLEAWPDLDTALGRELGYLAPGFVWAAEGPPLPACWLSFCVGGGGGVPVRLWGEAVPEDFDAAAAIRRLGELDALVQEISPQHRADLVISRGPFNIGALR